MTATKFDLTELADRKAAEDTVVRLARALDRRDWQELREVFADSVYVDDTSVWGGQAADADAQEVIRNWSGFLGRMEASQHMVSGLLSEVADDRAEVTANVLVAIRRANQLGSPLWFLGGTYEISLGRQETGWRITRYVLKVSWTSGNTYVITGLEQN